MFNFFFLDNGIFCFLWKGDFLVIGIIVNYVCVVVDMFFFEFGILLKFFLRLIISWNLKKVFWGINGGVIFVGLGVGLLGSIIIVIIFVLFLLFCIVDLKILFGGG